MVEALKCRAAPFLESRFDEVQMEKIERFKLPQCEHTAGPEVEDASAIATEYEERFDLLDVIRLGEKYFISTSKHFNASGVIRVCPAPLCPSRSAFTDRELTGSPLLS